MLGARVRMYLRNEAGDAWVAAPGAVAAAPTRRDLARGGLVHRRGREPLLAVEVPVGTAPWLVVLEQPVADVHAPVRRAVARLAVLGLVLVAAAAAFAWLLGRRIARPLGALTLAAERVARGERGTPVAVGGHDEIGRLATAFDVMAAEVAAAREELERRVLDAQQARAEAEGANRAKGDFLAVMSHELRTPLNAIGGYAKLLELGVYGPVTDAQREALGRIARSQAHLLRLITDVLSFARIDAGQMAYVIAAVPLADAVAALEPLVEPQLRAKGVAFACDAGDAVVHVRADRERLQQVVLNLLANAIKFTPAGGRVTVACTADAAHVRVRVADTGPGIPPERLGAVFEPFVQGDRALNRPHEGVGLGLAISRDLARAMGGDVTVASTVGAGSTFTLELPRAHDPAGEPVMAG